MTPSKDQKSVIRARIAAALPVFHFRRIETLFYLDANGREVREYADAQGALISSHRLDVTLSPKPCRQQLRNLAIPRRQPA